MSVVVSYAENVATAAPARNPPATYTFAPMAPTTAAPRSVPAGMGARRVHVRAVGS